MAMMMTGRVLLVCALCVLWCGACGGYAWDLMNDTLNEYYYGADGVFCKIFPKMYSCELKINASKAALKASTAQSGEVSGQPNAGVSPGGQDQTLKENGSDQSQGDAGTQLQKPGETPPEAPTPATPPATVTVAAQTSATTTPDESDGSTAASHTTSPLLLLVFVVCAAAVAVVAA
ncbi:mucin-associated surface protein (MASP) [Trypanosoma cruzi Dm28c]|uniref:Mucin-associated surface protein (MASP) n=2 Tax=Trypanosoma cruzi TaxID=5693 RepID=V5D9J6_TRYCR|nr:mucin-associated surface protein (MASP) [Trypanosoma cruzi Dm28c]PBJ74809.1 mucin-associated surface protein [Trypanosoma cruzi cruzi]PWU94927.1 Mucin-associated surface protein (MASP) [Trypanosoma cruzi]